MKIKKTFLVVVFMIGFIVPTLSLASDYIGGSKGFGIMEAIESKMMGIENHDEAVGLMREMMNAGTLSNKEIEKIAEMTNKYPGAMNMMMNRFVTYNVIADYNSRIYPIMGGWGTSWGSFLFLTMSVGALAWVAVGVLLAVWLIKQIGKK